MTDTTEYKAMSEQIKPVFPGASEEDMQNGWSHSFAFIDEIMNLAHHHGCDASHEDVDCVLLALEETVNGAMQQLQQRNDSLLAALKAAVSAVDNYATKGRIGVVMTSRKLSEIKAIIAESEQKV